MIARLAAAVGVCRQTLLRGAEIVKKTTVSAKLVRKEFRLTKWWAAKRNMPLSSLVRESLLNAIPKSARDTIAEADDHESALDAAFAALDQIEYEATGEKPIPTPPPQITAPPKRLLKRKRPEHPCAHLAFEFGHRYNAKDCAGTCRHPSRSGAVCFWSSMAASHCVTFSQRR